MGYGEFGIALYRVFLDGRQRFVNLLLVEHVSRTAVSSAQSQDILPYLWHDGVMSGLNDLVAGNPPLFLLFAKAINTRGEISGFGVTEKGDVHGFLAAPISGTPFACDVASPGPHARPALSDDARKLLQSLTGGFVSK